MVLRLRLARVPHPLGARRHRPFYNIVLAQARSARDSKPMEVLGTYNPIPQAPAGADPNDRNVRKTKEIKVDVSRAKYWLGVGAQPSDTVWRLLSMIGLLEPKFLPGRAEQEREKKGALRGVRFETHVPSGRNKATMNVSGAAEDSMEAVEPAEKEHTGDLENAGISEELGEKDAPAGTTSPMNPNAA